MLIDQYEKKADFKVEILLEMLGVAWLIWFGINSYKKGKWKEYRSRYFFYFL